MKITYFERMRKWLILFFIFVALFVLPYVLIPNKIYLSQTKTIVVNPKAFARTIQNSESWQRWWPGDGQPGSKEANAQNFTFRNYTYRVAPRQAATQRIIIASDRGSIATRFIFVPLQNDSVRVSWQGAIVSSSLPWARVSHYFAAKSLEEDWQEILNKMAAFYQETVNVYGIHVKPEKVKDPSLISISFLSAELPSSEKIYEQIRRLQAYASQHSATQTGYPMLNITRMRDTNNGVYFRTQIAIPVSNQLPDKDDISHKWMLAGGNILVTEVSGGAATVEQALQNMEKYVTDYNYISPAIPFQSLVTNRLLEKDTTKWVTKIYWPVM